MTVQSCKYSALLVSVLVVLTLPARAADWPPITPEQKSINAVPQQPDAPAVILYREDITDDAMNFRIVYVRLKILTEAGRRFETVEIPAGPNSGAISQVSGRTVQPDGQIIAFEGQPADKIVFRGRGMPTHVKALTLPSVQVGSILDYRYSLHFPEGSANPPEWMVQTDLFQKKVVFKFTPAKYQPKTDTFRGSNSATTNVGSVSMTTDKPSYERVGSSSIAGEVLSDYAWVQHVPAGKEPQQYSTQMDQIKWAGLELSDVPPAVQEPDMPPSRVVSWRIGFFYRSESKPDAYWKNVGKAWGKDVEKFLDHNNGVAQAVSQLVGAGDSADTKVAKIYDFVAQLQNHSFPSASNVAVTPALAAGAEDVLRSRGGTHDELNRLFVAMARAAGIPAMLSWVPDRGRGPFDLNYMSPDQLEAEIAIVTLGGKDVFLDPGTKFCPYGLLPWHYAGVRGLRQSANGSQTLADTPAPTYKDALVQRLAQVQVAGKGVMQGQVAVQFSGQHAMIRRQQAASLSADERKMFLENEVASWLPAGTQVTLTILPEWDHSEGALAAQFRVSGPLASNSAGRWILPLQIFEANAKPRFSDAQRTTLVNFEYASRWVDEVHISLPANVDLETLPAGAQAKTPYALYTSEQKREGTNALLSTRDLAVNGVLFSLKEYKELKDFYDKVAAGDSQTAALKGSL